MSTAKIKVKELPPAPKPTKAVKAGNPFHQIPGERDLPHPDKKTSKENEIIFEVRVMDEADIGLTITTNKYYFRRAKRAALDALDTWLNSFDVTASYYFNEDDLPLIEESTALELAIFLFKRLNIPAHIEGIRDIDPSMLEDTFFVSSRTNHLERKNRKKIPDKPAIYSHQLHALMM